MTLHPYAVRGGTDVWEADAVLAFHTTARRAKAMGWHWLRDDGTGLFRPDFTDVRVRRLTHDLDYWHSLRCPTVSGPHVVFPPYCRPCNLWNSPADCPEPMRCQHCEGPLTWPLNRYATPALAKQGQDLEEAIGF